ncbi:TetR/AcrR family transcriptional regulator [uncultured Arthrobacter sp.]|uniref:TetR/AcrR family transcriptional regulator n=1 Tax=uncultured Arthrobacter sp. TaxID=114050 RepID=UPI0028D644E9|nr:TetR/AcrR family transcriptional regulator [uncultured Arthrobacter sp.]
MNQLPRERANAAVREFLSSHDWSTQTPARRRILSAFLELATTRGFESVTMRTLGRELNMKAPSLYSSFPQGKDEIVAESLRWFTHSFARDLLAAAEETESAEDYWAALVRFHLAQQLQRPEADLWDLLVATDRVGRFLSDDVRDEVGFWSSLHEDMYAAAAEEMGYRLPPQSIRLIFTLLDGAGRWADWSGNDADLPELLDNAVALSRSIFRVSSGIHTPA